MAVLLTALGWTSAARSAEDQPSTKDRDNPDVRNGRELFVHKWRAHDPLSKSGDGLGPMYNARSCAECHNQGGAGGGGANSHNVQVLSRSVQPGCATSGGLRDRVVQLHPGLAQEPSVVLHRYGVAPDYASWRLERISMVKSVGVAIPAKPTEMRLEDLSPAIRLAIRRAERQDKLDDNVRKCLDEMQQIAERVQTSVSKKTQSPVPGTLAERNTPALFGAGLIDSISDQDLEEKVNVGRVCSAVRGRVARLADGRIGRFGWKAQNATLEDFALNACAMELGLEVPGHAQARVPTDPSYRSPGLDMDENDCRALVAYIESLPAPEQESPRDLGSDELQGRGMFASIGCADCHAERVGKVAGIYSDLLLHDMGKSLSGSNSYGHDPSPGELARQRSGATPAKNSEWRTPPLWGCRISAPYLHDGRAASLQEAIEQHAGEAHSATAKFAGLSAADQQRLVQFLKTL